MQEQELIAKIRDYIKSIYSAEYVGYLNVEKLNPGYKFSIGIPSYMCPTTFAIDCETDDEFLEYVYSELRSRNYIRLWIYKVLRQNDSREE